MVPTCESLDTSGSTSKGSSTAFDQEWQQAVITEDPRWFSYPAEQPTTQIEIFELVKAKQIQRLLADQDIREGRILEFGCGSAGMSIFLAEKGFDACAVDISPHALRVARINAARRGSPPSLNVLQGDGFRLPFGDGAFDVAMSYGLLEHFEEEQVVALLAEVLRVLGRGGLFVSDIVPGPRRFSVRALGTAVSYLASALYHLSQGRVSRARGLHREYFDSYFEATLDDRAWGRILSQAGLARVQVAVCRPFPPLALSGRLERCYVGLMHSAMPLWQRFDGRNTWLTRRWGWMYLAHGLKP